MNPEVAGSPPAVDEALALERNLALMAGAGAGKTWSLVALCLHVLGGARARPPLPASQLVLVTFTEKAAGELKERLRARLRALAAGERTGEEVLVRAFERLGKPFPTATAWQAVLEALAGAFVGTFHGLCVHLLRRAPPGLGVEPGFRLLDEREAGAVVQELARREVLEVLALREPSVELLCREWGFDRLVDALVATLTRLREEGRWAGGLAITDGALARERFKAALARAREALAAARLALEGRPRTAWNDALAELAGVLPALEEGNFLGPLGFPAVQRALEGTRLPPSGPHKEALASLKAALVGDKASGLPGLDGLFLALHAEPQERAVRGLLVSLEQGLEAHFRREGVLDFAALLGRTRGLLRDVPSFRAEVQGRVGALLVDEFQDTNRLQLELVHLLGEERAGGPRAVASPDEVLALPLEPGLVCAVGDRKQSIYEFRGADVAVFERLARSVEASGGARGFLRDNRRSTPALLRRFNHAFARVLRAREDAADHDVAYVPAEDDLRPVRGDSAPGAVVERLLPPESGPDRLAEADALALRLAQLLAPGAPERVAGRDGAPRPVRGSDVALLFRAFTHLETYRQALLRRGVPHRIVGGRGFYAAQEVLDVASCLAWVVDPSDRLALAAVMRSPFVGLTDAALYALQRNTHLATRRIRELLATPRGEAVVEDATARARLTSLLSLHAELSSSWDRIPVGECVQGLLERTDYRVCAAALPAGEQALANLDKLVELALAWRGDGGLPRFARELRQRAEEQPREEQALTLDATDSRAVQLLTIHRAKGLEWPVVVLPELGAARRGGGAALVYDRDVGLALRPVVPGAPAADPERLRRARELGRAREEAESRRLLYVALTRARDKVILSGAPRRKGGDSWWNWLEAALGDGVALSEQVTDVRPEELSPPQPAVPARPRQAQLSLLAEPPVAPRRAAPRTLVFPVTQLQDFSRCPRRYRYLHLLGLPESRVSLELEGPEDERPRSAPDARARGVLAHALLESLPLEVLGDAAATDGAAVALLQARGEDPEREELRELRRELAAFARGPLGRKMAALGRGRVHRELPFLLKLEPTGGGPALHLRGQVDLLLEDEDGGATVVDYKYAEAPPDPFLAYGFQLDCYALAARSLVAAGVPVRTGLVFLRGSGQPVYRTELPGGDEGRVMRMLSGLAGRWAEASGAGRWPGLEGREACARLHCGFLSRCHGAAGL